MNHYNIRSDVFVSLPQPDHGPNPVKFDFAYGDDGQGWLWTDNGIIRVEPLYGSGQRFRVAGKQRQSFRNLLGRPSTRAIKTTTGDVCMERHNDGVTFRWTNLEGGGAMTLSSEQFSAFVIAYDKVMAWAEAIDRPAQPLPPARKLLVLVADGLLREGKISLDLPADDLTRARFKTSLQIGRETAEVEVAEIGFGELSIKAAWAHPTNRNGARHAGIAVSGWLERKEGVYLMGEGKQGLLRAEVSRVGAALLERVPLPEKPAFKFEGPFRV